jgi:ABC-2 type transport system ATP-binding protein
MEERMAFIEVNNVCKEYKIFKAQPGIWGGIRSLFSREYTVKRAVCGISFSIGKGEVVGYIGPNGAGKSTTIKMLSGVLVPNSGSVTVDGIIPYENRKLNARHIGVVFGQHSQLYWDLPVSDSFELYQRLYEIDDATYHANYQMFVELLDMKQFMSQPARQLSLGQKMKANLALAMLHNPDILYLDEPTIGLDITSKKALRECITALNREKGTTIMLTTHDMDDIEATCSRLILINDGQKLFDGKLGTFKSMFENGYTVQMGFDNLPVWLDSPGFSLVKQLPDSWIVHVDKGISTKAALAMLIEKYDPVTIFIKEEDIEQIIHRIFSA